MRRWKANPTLSVVTIPGMGVLRRTQILEGDQFARFAALRPPLLVEILEPPPAQVAAPSPPPAPPPPAPVPPPPPVVSPSPEPKMESKSVRPPAASARTLNEVLPSPDDPSKLPKPLLEVEGDKEEGESAVLTEKRGPGRPRKSVAP
jgi:hypothetical protein